MRNERQSKAHPTGDVRPEFGKCIRLLKLVKRGQPTPYYVLIAL